MASIRDILNTFSLADQYRKLKSDQGVQSPEEQGQASGLLEHEMGPLRKGITRYAQGAFAGAANTFIDFPIGTAEAFLDAGRYGATGNPYPIEVPSAPRVELPRFAKEAVAEASKTPEGIAGLLTGGFAGGGMLAKVPVIGEAMLMNSLQGKMANTIDDLFANKEIGNTLLQEGLKLGARVGSRAAAGGTVNVLTDTSYNLSEATDEQGDVDFDKFADMEVQSALFGAAMGGGVSLADPTVFKSAKDISARILKGSFDQTTAAVKKSDEAIRSVKAFEEQKAIQKQIETLKEEQLIKAPETEVDIVNEVVDLNTKDAAWADEYQKARDEYLPGVEESLSAKDPVNKKTERIFDFVKEKATGFKEGYRDFVEPIYESMKRISPFGNDVYKIYKGSLPNKVGAEGTDISYFAKEYDEAFKGGIISNLGNKITGQKTDQALFALAVGSQDFNAARAVLSKQKNAAKLLQHFDNVEKILKNQGEELVQLGELRPESLKEDYWPRDVRDYKQMQEKVFEKLPEDQKTGFKYYTDELVKAKGRKLTPREYSQALDKYFSEKVIRSSSNLKERRIDKLTGKLLPYYTDPVVTLQNYARNNRERIEKVRLLKLKDPNWKPTDKKVSNRMQKLLEEAPDRDQTTLQRDAIRDLYREQMIHDPAKVTLEADINSKVEEYKIKRDTEGAYKGATDEDLKQYAEDYFKDLNKGIYHNLIENKANYLVKQGKLSLENVDLFKKQAEAVFIKADIPRGQISKTLSAIGYNALLGHIQPALTQINDVGPTLSRYGLSKGTYSYMQAIADEISGGKLGGLIYTPSKLGIDRAIDQLYDTKNAPFWAEIFMKPLGLIDRLGKKGAVQASLGYWSNAAKSEQGINKLVKKYGDVFTEKEMKSLVESLKSGDDNPLVRDLMIYEVGKVTPTSIVDRPKAYLDNPRFRILYDLKNFMLKRHDYIYKELLKPVVKNPKDVDAWKNLTGFLIATPALAAGVKLGIDYTKHEVTEIDPWDRINNAYLDSLGLSSFKYFARYGLKAFPGQLATGTFLPPVVGVGAEISSDLFNVMQGNKEWDEVNSWRYLPPVGPSIKGYREGELPWAENVIEPVKDYVTGSGQIERSRQQSSSAAKDPRFY